MAKDDRIARDCAWGWKGASNWVWGSSWGCDHGRELVLSWPTARTEAQTGVVSMAGGVIGSVAGTMAGAGADDGGGIETVVETEAGFRGRAGPAPLSSSHRSRERLVTTLLNPLSGRLIGRLRPIQKQNQKPNNPFCPPEYIL